MSNFVVFLLIVMAVVVVWCGIALICMGAWEILKYIVKKARGWKNENSSNRT